MKRCYAIIIETWQAGPPLAGRLTENGMEVAIIERKFFGGTCVNTGCRPKDPDNIVDAAHLARRAADFGVVGGGVTVDMKRTKARTLFKYNATSDTFTPDGSGNNCGYKYHTTVNAKDNLLHPYQKR